MTYPRKNHNHNDNVDLGALGTAPKKTRRSLKEGIGIAFHQVKH